MFLQDTNLNNKYGVIAVGMRQY